MDHGLYTAYLGMRARQRTLDVMANNIANASTPGFKADRTLYRSVEAAEIEAATMGATTMGAAAGRPATRAVIAEDQIIDTSHDASHGRNIGVVTRTVSDFSNGMIRQTGRALDVALEGDGFLVVQTGRGERYTRAGSLALNPAGQLITQQGDLVVGEKGPITVGPGQMLVGANGDISVDGQPVATLKLVRFDNPRTALLKEGESLFIATDPKNNPPVPATGTRVTEGALEASNVASVSEMAAMIQNSREFDTLQKSITMLMNDLGRKVASEIGRL